MDDDINAEFIITLEKRIEEVKPRIEKLVGKYREIVPEYGKMFGIGLGNEGDGFYIIACGPKADIDQMYAELIGIDGISDFSLFAKIPLLKR